MTAGELFHLAEKRSRRLRALTVGGWAFLGAAAASALYTGLAWYVFGVQLDPLRIGLLAGVPWLVGLLFFLALLRRPVDLGGVLLAMDYRLGLEALFSSLYEIDQRSPTSFLRKRLERRAAHAFPEWREGLPMPLRFVLSSAGGLLLVIGVSLVGIQSATYVPSVDLRAILDEMKEAQRMTLEEAEDAASEDEGASISGITGASETADGGLDRLLSDLGLATDDRTTSEDAQGAIEVGADPLLEEALETWLGEVGERFGHGKSFLTPEQQESLVMAAQSREPIVQSALDRVLEAGSRDEVESALADLADALRETQMGQLASDDSTRVTPAGGEGSESGDQGSGKPLALQDTDTSGGAGSPSGSEQAGQEEETGLRDDPEPSTFYGQTAPTDPSESGLTIEEVPTSVSDAGDVRTYLTLGVPIEFDSNESEGTSASVDYDRIDMILESRSLSADATDIVRKYFQSITEGGS